MASSAGFGIPAQQRRVNLRHRVLGRATGQRRPLQGNSPDGRKNYPDCEPSQESLRQWPSASLPAPGPLLVSSAHHRSSRGTLNLAFFQASRNLSVRCGQFKIIPSWGRGTASRWSAPGPAKGRDGRSAPCSSSTMSSGRLFLDRVARQQSPSPLHRHPQNNTHSSNAQAKGDISTLPERGHFYLALTHPKNRLDLTIGVGYAF